MRPILLAPLAILFVVQQGRFEGTVTANTAFIKGHTGKATFTQKWPKERLDVTLTAIGKVTVLYDFDARTRTVINPSKKQYWTVDMGERAKEWRQALEEDGYQPRAGTVVVSKTSRTDEIAGHPCKFFTVGSAQMIDVCVANNMGVFVADPEINGAQAMGGTTNTSTDTTYDDLGSRFPGGYFPLKIISRANGPERVVWQVTSIDRHDVGDKEFVIPEGYTKTSPPPIK